jgi:tetratricopeptide (TPR) repeat protein
MAEANILKAHESDLASNGKSMSQDEIERDARNHLIRGADCERAVDWDGAITNYLCAARLPSSDPVVRYFARNNLGFSLNQIGRFAESEMWCNAAIEVEETRYNAHKNLGVALEGQGRHLEAAQSYLRAVWIAPSEPRSARHLELLLRANPNILKDSPDLAQELISLRERQNTGRMASVH